MRRAEERERDRGTRFSPSYVFRLTSYSTSASSARSTQTTSPARPPCASFSSPAMSTPWAAVLSSPGEKEAFFSLLDEYFSGQRSPAAAPAAPAAPRRVAPPPAAHTPSTAPTPRPPATPTSAPAFSASTFVADRALQNTAGTSAALRNAGLSAGAASTLSKFGAQHHEKLAPHVAAGAKAGWANRGAVAAQAESIASKAGPPVSSARASALPSLSADRALDRPRGRNHLQDSQDLVALPVASTRRAGRT